MRTTQDPVSFRFNDRTPDVLLSRCVLAMGLLPGQTRCAHVRQTRLNYIHENCRNAKKCVFGTGDLEAGMELEGEGGGGEGGGGEGSDHAAGCGGLLVRERGWRACCENGPLHLCLEHMLERRGWCA